MFNLERAIADWRQRMIAHGITTPAPLEELENHLREEMEQQLRAGAEGPQAFANAAERIGRPEALRLEFEKISGVRETRWWKLVAISYCVFGAWISGVVIYAWLKVPQLSDAFSLGDRLWVFAAVAVGVLSIPAWRWAFRFLPVIRSSRTRAALGVPGCGVGIVGMLLFWQFVFPMFWQLRAQTFTVLVAWAWSAMMILAGVGYGLAGAAQRISPA